MKQFKKENMVPRKWSITTGILTNNVDSACMNYKRKF